MKKIFDAAVRTNSTKAAGPVVRMARAAIMRVMFALTDPGKAQAAVQDFTIDWDRPVHPADRVPAGRHA